VCHQRRQPLLHHHALTSLLLATACFLQAALLRAELIRLEALLRVAALLPRAVLLLTTASFLQAALLRVELILLGALLRVPALLPLADLLLETTLFLREVRLLVTALSLLATRGHSRGTHATPGQSSCIIAEPGRWARSPGTRSSRCAIVCSRQSSMNTVVRTCSITTTNRRAPRRRLYRPWTHWSI
jgi:hypothetical protein